MMNRIVRIYFFYDAPTKSLQKAGQRVVIARCVQRRGDKFYFVSLKTLDVSLLIYSLHRSC
jgi:hypothetical protein